MALTTTQTIRAIEYIKTKLTAKEDVNLFAIVGHLNKHRQPNEFGVDVTEIKTLVLHLKAVGTPLLQKFYTYEKYNTLHITGDLFNKELKNIKIIPAAPSEEVNDLQSGKTKPVRIMTDEQAEDFISAYKQKLNGGILGSYGIPTKPVVKRGGITPRREFNIDSVLGKINGNFIKDVLGTPTHIEKQIYAKPKANAVDSVLTKLLERDSVLNKVASVEPKLSHVQLVEDFVLLGNGATKFKYFYDDIIQIKKKADCVIGQSLVDCIISRLGRRKYNLNKQFVKKVLNHYYGTI